MTTSPSLPKYKCPTCFRPYKKDRSSNQNRYYWGIIIALLSDHTGYSTDEMHEACKHKFLKRVISVDWEDIEITTSTTDLTTAQFEDYCKQIREWAAVKLQMFIPLPNESLYENAS